MNSVYEFGDAHPIVKVWFDRDGWEWFRDLVRSELSASDTFLADINTADLMLAESEDEDG